MSGTDADLWRDVNAVEERTERENGIKETALLDLLTQIADSKSETGGALRVTEICDIMGWSLGRVRQQIRKLKERGMIEVVPVMVVAIDDTMRRAKAYRLKDNES